MKPKTTNIIATLFAALWLYTAFSKIMGYDIFLIQLKMSNILGTIALPISILIPLMEIAIAGLLLTAIYTQWNNFLKNGLLASAGLLAMFTLYIGIMMLTNSHLPCTCGGFIQKLPWPQHLVFNIVLIGIAIMGIALIKDKKEENYTHPQLKAI